MAKFKIGDKVRRGGQIGVVKGVEKEPYIEVKFTNEPVTVFVHEEELVSANAVLNAKFKVGQKVRLTHDGLFYMGKDLEGVVGVIEKEWHDEHDDIFMPSYIIGGELGKRLNGRKRFEGGKDISRRVEEDKLVLANSRAANAAVRSRNAVVQKALNAVARNESIRHPYTAAGKRFMEKARASIRKASDKDLGPGGMWLPNMLSEMERTPGLSDDEMDLIQDDLYRLIAANAQTGVLRETAVNANRSTNAVVAKALNAKFKLSSKEAKAGDLVRVAGALGTYVVTKVDGDWIEITDAEDGTPHGRVEARYATPVVG